MKRIMKQSLSFLMALVMVITLIPPTDVSAAKADEAELEKVLRTSVSDEEYPDGMFGFELNQLTVTEGEETTINIFRQGNTDKEATVMFKAVDISAEYGKDYTMTVIHSGLKREQFEANEDSMPLMVQDAEVTESSQDEAADVPSQDKEAAAEEEIGDTIGNPVGDISAVSSNNAAPEETVSSDIKEKAAVETAEEDASKEEAAAETEDADVEEEAEAADQTLDKTSKGISAAFAIQNRREAPEYDWQEVNPENAPAEVTEMSQMRNEAFDDFMESAEGVGTTLAFKPGEYAKKIIVNTIDDDRAESEEQIMFFLYDAQGAEIGANYNGYVNIQDNDESVDNVFAMQSADIVVSPDEDIAKVTVVRTGGVDQLAFVTVGTKGETAKAGVDYESVTQELIFAPGISEKTVEISITGERTENKTFYVGISEDGVVVESGKNATLVTIAQQNTDSDTQDGIITAAATTKTVNANQAFDYRYASSIKVYYTLTGSCNVKKCKKTYHKNDKGFTIKVGNVLSRSESKTGQDTVSGTVTFSREMFSSKNNFMAWDGLGSAKITATAWGCNDNSNASISITKVEVTMPEISFTINNDSTGNYYHEKMVTSITNKGAVQQTDGGEIMLGRSYFGTDSKGNLITNKTINSFPTAQKLGLNSQFTGAKNTKGVPANSDTVALLGWKFKDQKSLNSYSKLITNLDKVTIDKAFLNDYYNYMVSGSFIIMPVYEPKKLTLQFDNSQAMVNKKANVKGTVKNYQTGTTYENKLTKLDTITLSAASNSGYAVQSIQMTGNKKFAASNLKENTVKTTYVTGFGNCPDTSYKVTVNYENASLKVIADPKDKGTEAIKKGQVLYIDENNNAQVGKYDKELVINNVLMNKNYNIVGIADDGYRPSWRDGTIDYDGDGEITDEDPPNYKSFTPVKGSVLTYPTKLPNGKIYYTFEALREINSKSDIYGYIRVEDSFILTGEEFTKGINGATVVIDQEEAMTSTGGVSARNKADGFFRISKKTFHPHDYYLAAVNYDGDEGRINTCFVINPAKLGGCTIKAAEELQVDNAHVYLKEDDEYIEQEIGTNADGYFTAVTNGPIDTRIEMQAHREGVSMKSAVLQFYDKEGKKLDKSVEGIMPNGNNDGVFRFDFNPEKMGLPVGTTLRVTFTDTQGYVYLQRELGMYLSQYVGVLDIVNSFNFGSANTVVQVVGKVDSMFDLGWNGQFDKKDNVVIDKETGDKTISVGYNKKLIESGEEKSAIKKASDALVEKEEAVAKANQEYRDTLEKLGKKKTLTTNEKNELKAKETAMNKAKAERAKQKETYDKEVGDAQTPKKKTAEVSKGGDLEVSFSFMLTFGNDNGEYYFKTMVLSATVSGGFKLNVKFATPVGITIDLGFATGGEGTASFVVEERADRVHPTKYYIKNLVSGEGNSIDLFNCSMKDDNRKFDAYGSFNLKPYITLSAGVGFSSVVEVTVSGTARFDMTFYTLPSDNKGSVNVSSDITIELLGGLISHKWSLASADINLFGNSGGSSIGVNGKNYLYANADILDVTDMSYMADGTLWKTGGISAKSLDESEDCYKETSVADKIAKNPDFRVISIGEKKYLAVFTNTVAGRDTMNSKGVYYTIYDGTSWQEPKLIDDGGMMCQDPAVFDLGTHGAFITWSAATKDLSKVESRVEMQNAMDLHGVFFDKSKNTIGAIQQITKETKDTNAESVVDYSDYAADVAANVSYNNDKMIVYYEKKEYSASKEAEYLGDVIYPEYALMAARVYDFTKNAWVDTYTEKETEGIDRPEDYTECFYGQEFFDFFPNVRIDEKLDETGYATAAPTGTDKAVAYGNNVILDMDATSYNDLGIFAYTIDLDGDLTTCADREIYMQIYDFETGNFLHPIVVTSDGVEDRNIRFVRIKSGDTYETYLSWLRDGDIVALDMGNIVHNYNNLLVKRNLSYEDANGDTITQDYYYINKQANPDAGEDAPCYIPPFTIVKGEISDSDAVGADNKSGELGQSDEAISKISSFEVKANEEYVYFVWTQIDSELKDGIEEGTVGADDPANRVTESQMYVARYDIAAGRATNPIQVTGEKGANYADAAFEVEGDNLVGLVYKAPAKLMTYEEYNEIIKKNNEYAQKENGSSVSANTVTEEVTELSFVPYTVPDIENATAYAFRMDPKGAVKVKNATYETAVAGETANLSFDLLNEGVDTVKELKLTAKDAAGNNVLLAPKTKTETDAQGGSVEVLENEIKESVTINELFGGYSYAGSCQLSLPVDAVAAEVTITVTDQNGAKLAEEVVRKELSSDLTISNLKAEKTDVRNQYKISGMIGNIGTASAESGKLTIASVNGATEKTYASVEYAKLAPNEEYAFEKVITVSPKSEFVTVTDEDGGVTETGTIIVTAGDAQAQTTIERSADAEFVNAVKAISSLKMQEATDGKLTMQEGETKRLTPVIVSSLADAENEITGEESIQYRFESSDSSVVSVDDGMLSAEKAGSAEVTVYAYPKADAFVAASQTADNEVDGYYTDSFITMPEAVLCIGKVTVTVPGVITEEPTPQPTPSSFGEKNIEYKVTAADEVSVGKVTGSSDKTIRIPETVSHAGKIYKVTSIETSAFEGNKKATKIVVGKNVKVIGDKAFKNCSALTSIALGANVTMIGKEAFAGCKKLKKVTIPKKCTTIKDGAFKGCKSLKKIVIKAKKMKSIGKQTFKGISSEAVFKLSGTRKQKTALKKMITAKKTGYKSTMKIK